MPADAQYPLRRIQPSNPTSIDPIFVEVYTPTLGWVLHSVVVNGNEVEIRVCCGDIVAAVGLLSVPIGRLPPGTYQIVVIYDYDLADPVDDMRRTLATIVVQAAHFVPTASVSNLVLLAVTLCLAGLVGLRR